VDDQLDIIRRAYDLTVEQYRNGIDPLGNIPDEIRNSDFFTSFTSGSEQLNSSAADIREYLSPEPGMRFLDAGCSANLANHRLDKWPSTYYGVDISPALIEAMKRFAEQQKIRIGGLELADISNLPFDNCYFDIAAVIGVFEYCTIEYIRKALSELNRVLKPGSRLVLDLPNDEHPHFNDMLKLEEYLGRPNITKSRNEFEDILTSVFKIERTDDSKLTIKYFVRSMK
jgi:ubiquinone/menaquinone biosynthesis C-methylase UbiE